MASRQALLMTAEDYRLLPEAVTPCQLIKGELFMSPSPSRYHQEILGWIHRLIGNFLSEVCLGKVFPAPLDVHLTEKDVFQPDLFFVANDRLSILTESGASGAPTLIVEILSGSTERKDRSIKKAVYAGCGVEELWLVDPERKWVEVYRLAEDSDRPQAVFGEGETFQSVCLPGLVLDVRECFAR